MLGKDRIAATILKALAAPVAVSAVMAQPVAAQHMSEGYEFLKAVKERDGDTVINALNQPGNTLINTRDFATGRTAMHIVTERRDANWIAFLTARGGNPDIATDDHPTVKAALAARDRQELGLNAPPHGLYFVSASYGTETGD